MKISSILALIGTLWIFTGCVQPTAQDPSQSAHRESESASFYIGEVKKTHVSATDSLKAWDIPTAKKYTLSTCLKEMLTNNKLPGHPFSIHIGKNIVSAQTDADGCLSWTHKIPYNFLGDSRHVLLKGFIRSEGILKGQRMFEVALNPWTQDRGGKIPEFVDLQKSTALPEGSLVKSSKEVNSVLQGLNQKTNSFTERFIWAPKINYSATELGRSQKGVSTEIRLSIEPEIMLKDIYGAASPYSLKKGLFDVWAQIVAVTLENGRYVRVPLTQSMPARETAIVNGRLDVVLPALLKHQAYSGVLEIALRLIPKGGPVGLERLEGIYRMGEPKKIFQAQTAHLQKKWHNIEQSFDLKKDYVSSFVSLKESDLPNNIYSLINPVSFYIDKLEGASIPTKMDKRWKLPQARRYNVVACLKNGLTNENVQSGQSFLVKINGKETSLKTEVNGCISWNEDFAYNSLAQSKNVFIQREVIGLKNHYGSRQAKFLINPWNKDRKSGLEFIEQTTVKAKKFPVDLITEEKQAFSQLMPANIKNHGYLHIDRVTTKIYQTQRPKNGLNLKLNLNFQPKLVLFDEFGQELAPKNVTSGKFKVIPYLVAVLYEKEKEERILLSEVKNIEQTKVSVKNSQLNANIDVLIPGRYRKGSLELGLRLVSLEDGNTIRDFSGVFNLGSAHKVSGGSLYPIEKYSKKSFSIDKDYLQKVVSIKTLKDIPYANTFELININAKMKDIYSQTATKRTVIFSVSAQVADGFNSHYIEGEDFTIRIKGQEGQNHISSSDHILKRKTKAQGKIEWNDMIFHKYYTTERYLKKTFILEHKSGFSKEYHLYINPWTKGFQFFKNADSYDEKDIENDKRRVENALPSRLFIARYKLETLNYSYAVDKFLNLEVHKHFQLQLEPYVIRHSISHQNGAHTSESLKDGVYLLKVALQKSYFGVDGQMRDFISPVQKLVTVKNGLIITPVTFTVRDKRLMRLRNLLFVQLETVDIDKVNSLGQSSDFNTYLSRDYSIDNLQKYNRYNFNTILDKDSGLKTRTFMGPVILLSKASSAAMRPTDDLSSEDCDVPNCDQLSYLRFASKEAIQKPVNRSHKSKPSEKTVEEKLGEKIYNFTNKEQSDLEISFKDMTVTKLIEQWRRMEKNYRKNMEKQSSFEQFVANNNLEVVQLSDEVSVDSMLNSFPVGKQYKYNKVFTESSNSDSVLKRINSSYLNLGSVFSRNNFKRNGIQTFSTVQRKDFVHFINTGKMTPVLTTRMCQFFFNTLINYKNAQGIRLFDADESDSFITKKKHSFAKNLVKRCNTSLLKGLEDPIAHWQGLLERDFSNPEDIIHSEETPFPFILSEHIKIHDIESSIESSGLAINFNISTSFNETAGQNKTNSISLYANPLKWLEGTFSKLLNGIGFSVSTSRSSYKSKNSSIGASTGTYLSTQMKQIYIRPKKYESCRTIKINPDFFNWDPDFFSSNLNIPYLVNKHYSGQEVFQRLTRGLVLCSGQIMEQPKNTVNPKFFRETYYYTTQHFTEGDILDFSNLINHPWLLSVRGRNTFTSFIQQLDGRRVVWDEKSQVWREPNLEDQREDFELGFYPVDRLSLAYASYIPSTPGFYTVLSGENFKESELSFERDVKDGEFLNQEDESKWFFNNLLKYLDGQ